MNKLYVKKGNEWILPSFPHTKFISAYTFTNALDTLLQKFVMKDAVVKIIETLRKEFKVGVPMCISADLMAEVMAYYAMQSNSSRLTDIEENDVYLLSNAFGCNTMRPDSEQGCNIIFKD